MKQTNYDCHSRFVQQAGWTHDLRQYLYTRVAMDKAQRILDVGCGTGVLLDELQTHGQQAFGVDINDTHAKMAMRKAPTLSCADARFLPYPAQTFDITLCHFLLLWVDKPTEIVREMARVTRPGGAVLALAEPDYGGRIDYPEPLSILGEWQSEALQWQGADPCIGRKLASIFQQAELENVETGVLGGHWVIAHPSSDAWELEWQVLEKDLAQLPDGWNRNKLSKLYEIEQRSRMCGERVLFVPTFWALGNCKNLSVKKIE